MKVGREGMLTSGASNKAHGMRCFIWINSESGISQGFIIVMYCAVTRSSGHRATDYRVQVPPLLSSSVIMGKFVNLLVFPLMKRCDNNIHFTDLVVMMG